MTTAQLFKRVSTVNARILVLVDATLTAQSETTDQSANVTQVLMETLTLLAFQSVAKYQTTVH